MSKEKETSNRQRLYTKEQLQQSKQINTDLLAVLEDGKQYTLPEAKRMIENYLKKEAT